MWNRKTWFSSSKGCRRILPAIPIYMFNYRFYLCLMLAPFINGLLSPSISSQTYVINGTLEKRGQETNLKDSVVRKESLSIEDKRVYIQLVIDQGARTIRKQDQQKRYKNLSFLLPPGEIVYDDASKRILYYKDDAKIEVGRAKSFVGLMPYIALADGVRILSSPTDAKLLVSLDRDTRGLPIPVTRSEEDMEATLGKKCGQCHILEYIFSHKKWGEEDILHAFNRLQMEREEKFTEEQQKIIDLFKRYQKGEIDKEKLAEFKSLRQIGEKDVRDITETVYMNNCVPCHEPSRITDIPFVYSKKRCKNIVDRMKEKEPSLFLQTDMDRLAGFLWEIKLRPSVN